MNELIIQIRESKDDFDIEIIIDDESTIDSIISSLVRNGYEVYINKEDKRTNVCFKTSGKHIWDGNR